MYNLGNVTSTAVCFQVTFKRTFKLSFWGGGWKNAFLSVVSFNDYPQRYP